MFRRVTGPFAIATAATAYVAVFISWICFRWGPGVDSAVIGDVAFLPMSLVAAIFSWRLAGRCETVGDRQAWRFFAAAYGCYWAGDLCWFYSDAVRGSRPFPSVADLFYVAFYPLLVAGLFRLPRARRTTSERFTLGLDTATVTLGSLLIVWYLVIEPTVSADRGAPWLTRVLDVTYPVGDTGVLFALAVVVLSGDRSRDPGLMLLAAGLATFVLADVIYARQSLDGSYTDGSWVNVLWMVGQAATIVSTQFIRGPNRLTLGVGEGRIRVPRLPYLAIAAALALLATVSVEHLSRSFVELVFGVVALSAVVVTRQLTVLHENRRLLGELRRVAETDALTDLISRRHFFLVAESAIRHAEQAGQNIGALMIDIDHFKSVNDTFGHAGGDAVLAEVARRCRDALRATDLLGRYGGDELVALLPGATAESLGRAAERLNFAVAALPIEIGPASHHVTLSIGASEADHPTTIEELLSTADAALYQAKKAGRAGWKLHVTA